MKTQRMYFIILITGIWICGCGTDSKESLENKAVSLMRETAAVLNTIDSESAAQKAIPKLEKLQQELTETKAKLAEYGSQDIASEYGIRVFNCFMNEVIPAMNKAQTNAPQSYDAIADIITSGEHTRAQKAQAEAFGTNIPTGEDYLKTHPRLEPAIADCIRSGQVIKGMTKEQVIASLGSPNGLSHDNQGGEELLYVDNKKMIRYQLKDGIYTGTMEQTP